MRQLAWAYKEAMRQSNGRLPEAAAILAEALHFDESLRLEASVALVGTMLQLSHPLVARSSADRK